MIIFLVKQNFRRFPFPANAVAAPLSPFITLTLPSAHAPAHVSAELWARRKSHTISTATKREYRIIAAVPVPVGAIAPTTTKAAAVAATTTTMTTTLICVVVLSQSPPQLLLLLL